MSKDAYGNWRELERAAYSYGWLEEQGLTRKEWGVLMALAKRINQQSGVWHMSYEALGVESMQSRSSAFRAVEELVRVGALEITRAKHRTGVHTFRVTLPSLADLVAAAGRVSVEPIPEEAEICSPCTYVHPAQISDGVSSVQPEHDLCSLNTICSPCTRSVQPDTGSVQPDTQIRIPEHLEEKISGEQPYTNTAGRVGGCTTSDPSGSSEPVEPKPEITPVASVEIPAEVKAKTTPYVPAPAKPIHMGSSRQSPAATRTTPSSSIATPATVPTAPKPEFPPTPAGTLARHYWETMGCPRQHRDAAATRWPEFFTTLLRDFSQANLTAMITWAWEHPGDDKFRWSGILNRRQGDPVEYFCRNKIIDQIDNQWREAERGRRATEQRSTKSTPEDEYPWDKLTNVLDLDAL